MMDTKTQEQHMTRNRVAKTPLRTCVVCRESVPTSELLGLKVIKHMLVVDQKAGGRGAYVHPSLSCLKGLEVGILERALRTRIDFENTHGWLSNLRNLAQKRILECIGLARRSGKLQVGLDDISKVARKNRQSTPLIFCADDLAEGSQKKCGQKVHVFCSGNMLGEAVGRSWAGVVSICDVRQKERAFYWWNLWQQLSFVA